MSVLSLYNSLTKKIEEFRPLSPDLVTMYTCGPTVYYFQHIGNFRTFVVSDLLHRTLKFNDYKVKFIMNLTDVGHLTGDNIGDTSIGDDKIEVQAEKEGKSAREISDYYIKQFIKDYDLLNILHPKKFTRATEYINEQIELIKKLEEKGFTYKTSDGIYFDTSKFKDYGSMSGLTAENIREGARVKVNEERLNPNDFALWKFSDPKEKRWQEWSSPWGVGFPGWHIECSAMAMSELGETIDIHVGGEDHKMIHHPNEIAQSEACTGKKFVKYWIHSSFLVVDNQKMGKSLGNTYTVSDIKNKGYLPLSLRYFYLNAHHRTPLNFTWNAMQNADNSLRKLYSLVSQLKFDSTSEINEKYYIQFLDTMNEDLNVPKALSILWELLKDSSLNDGQKLKTALKFDEVLGLRLEDSVDIEIPKHILDLAKNRDMYRKSNIWDKADLMRMQIEKEGYIVEDTPTGYKVKKKF